MRVCCRAFFALKPVCGIIGGVTGIIGSAIVIAGDIRTGAGSLKVTNVGNTALWVELHNDTLFGRLLIWPRSPAIKLDSRRSTSFPSAGACILVVRKLSARDAILQSEKIAAGVSSVTIS